MRVLVEACVDSVASAQAAHAGGAGRLELCADPQDGGTTPSAGLIAACRAAVPLPLFVLIRPRGGDFLYSATELDVMRRDIAAAREHGADGVVSGALQRDGRVDVAAMEALLAAARPLPVTFHRAFDFTRDGDEALEALIALGVTRVLTAGRAPDAVTGIPALAALWQRAAERITILAGGGITAANAGRVVRETGVQEVHVRAAAAVASRMAYRPAGLTLRKPPTDEWTRAETDREQVAAVVAAVAS